MGKYLSRHKDLVMQSCNDKKFKEFLNFKYKVVAK